MRNLTGGTFAPLDVKNLRHTQTSLPGFNVVDEETDSVFSSSQSESSDEGDKKEGEKDNEDEKNEKLLKKKDTSKKKKKRTSIKMKS